MKKANKIQGFRRFLGTLFIIKSIANFFYAIICAADFCICGFQHLPCCDFEISVIHLIQIPLKHFKTDLKGPFWATSREVNRSDFVAAAERFKKVYSDTFETLKKIHPKFWSKYKFDTI